MRLSTIAFTSLRRRKARPAKPFAVMVPDLDAARGLAHLTPEDEALLAGPRAPIVLAPARPGALLAPSVSPGQDRVGLFLPYTPLHHLLFRRGGFRALVMTSGNRSDEPIVASCEEAREKLTGVADLFLVHDRPILHRVDDSVVKPLGTRGPVVLRRARGYAPAPLPLPNPQGRTVLAVGAELANAVAVVRGPHVYLGPHFGDLKSLEVEEAFRDGIDHLLGLLGAAPDLVVCDRHPDYRSTRYAREWEARGVEVVAVQHHEAHAAACMAENGHRGRGVVLALDGLGYGGDGTLWGGEILAGRPGSFRRAGHLVPVPQPGGDRAAREPWRMAASHLRRLRGPGWRTLPPFRERSGEELDVLEAMLDRGFQSPLTSSCGRLFDAAAAILGFSGPLLYSAQAAMELEALAAAAPAGAEPYPFGDPPPREGALVLDPGPLLEALLEDRLGGRDRVACAGAFHAGLAKLWALGAAEACRREGARDVFLTGGCVQNSVFVGHLARDLEALGLTPRLHREVPPNDGGIAYGQAAWALGAG
ncbi:MAG: carbamoyltransferase HypF [Deltaproteobacteria bacterium]|nr:carbamoyltransferase HypF [Deltaproteobacteria bacterium]